MLVLLIIFLLVLAIAVKLRFIGNVEDCRFLENSMDLISGKRAWKGFSLRIHACYECSHVRVA